MVVPVIDEPKIKMDKKELVGNRKEFRIELNKNRLRIIGNGNKIIVKSNEGSLDIIGNMIRVKVLNNSGKINFIGNNSKIYIGKDSKNTTVQCSGNDIKFKLVPKEYLISKLLSKSQNQHEHQKHQESSNNSENSTSKSSDIKNNISLPNLMILDTIDINNCIRISNSTGNIFIGNSLNL